MPANVWPNFPYPGLVTASGVALVSMAVLVASRHFDTTGGLLTLSLLIVLAFIAVSLVSMLYDVPQTPTTEILIGSLATSLGALMSFWMSRRKD